MIKLQKSLTVFGRTATLSLRNFFTSTIISALQFLKMFWKTTYFYVNFEEQHAAKFARKSLLDLLISRGGHAPGPPPIAITIISLQRSDFPLDPPLLVEGLSSKMDIMKDRMDFQLKCGNMKVSTDLEKKMVEIEEQRTQIEYRNYRLTVRD